MCYNCPMVIKKNIVSQLTDLSGWETNPFKKRAYLKAGEIISHMDDDEFFNRGSFLDIPGIGAAINEKIMQFKRTGVIKKWMELSEKSNPK